MNAAQEAVLSACYKLPGIACMRELSPRNPRSAKGRCAVVDNSRWDSPILFQGETWEAVLAQIRTARGTP